MIFVAPGSNMGYNSSTLNVGSLSKLDFVFNEAK